jgi:hypothetical protein
MIKNYKEADIEMEMLDGNINRMKLTKDLKELESMHAWAVKRVNRLYLFYSEELRKKVNHESF